MLGAPLFLSLLFDAVAMRSDGRKIKPYTHREHLKRHLGEKIFVGVFM
jgi:hypothetical protein